MKLPRRRFLNLAVGAVALPFLPVGAGADTYPNRYVRFIVPFPPGGASDPVARVWGAPLADIWGQQVVVENKGGAGGNIGALAAAQSSPDGYTVFIATLAALAYPPVRQKFVDIYVLIVTSTPQEVTTYLKAQMAQWSAIIKDVNIKLN